jgi:signal peptidase I
MDKKELKKLWKKVWYFVWEDNSVWSWIVNIILAFVLIKFVVYPGLGFVLTTSHPVVAVVSGSMEHNN